MREIKFVAELPGGRVGHFTQYYVSTLRFSHKSQGYIMRKVRNHPYADGRGFVREHRLVMEEYLGRFLIPKKEQVHHVDGVRDNNVISNLKLITPNEHHRGHAGERNTNGQFVASEPMFSELKFKLLNTNTGECRPYSLSELIGKTYRRGQFKFRGRFTGLHDKNGVEIYEGDILQNDEEQDMPAVVEWCNNLSGYIIDWDGHQLSLSDDLSHETIIGNIHENPDLICEK